MHDEKFPGKDLIRSQKNELVPGRISYSLWKNKEGRPVEISIIFKTSLQQAYQMSYDSFMDFCKKDLRLGQEICSISIPSYFSKMTGKDFEQRLNIHGIPFKKNYI